MSLTNIFTLPTLVELWEREREMNNFVRIRFFL